MEPIFHKFCLYLYVCMLAAVAFFSRNRDSFRQRCLSCFVVFVSCWQGLADLSSPQSMQPMAMVDDTAGETRSLDRYVAETLTIAGRKTIELFRPICIVVQLVSLFEASSLAVDIFVGDFTGLSSADDTVGFSVVLGIPPERSTYAYFSSKIHAHPANDDPIPP